MLAANDVTVLVDAADRYTPTPAVSHAILRANRGRVTGSGLADGIVVTPSHNPPSDGGFKYNPPHGGPADTDATGWIARRANELLAAGAGRRPADAARHGPASRRRRTTSSARTSTTCPAVVDIDAIRAAGVHVGADPLGGASVDYWAAIAERHRLDLTVVNPRRRPDVAVHDARLGRQDPHGLLVAGRHGVAHRTPRASSRSPPATTPTPTATASSRPDGGLMNPNHFLAVAIAYLFANRDGWSPARRSARRSCRRR